MSYRAGSCPCALCQLTGPRKGDRMQCMTLPPFRPNPSTSAPIATLPPLFHLSLPPLLHGLAGVLPSLADVFCCACTNAKASVYAKDQTSLHAIAKCFMMLLQCTKDWCTDGVYTMQVHQLGRIGPLHQKTEINNSQWNCYSCPDHWRRDTIGGEDACI